MKVLPWTESRADLPRSAGYKVLPFHVDRACLRSLLARFFMEPDQVAYLNPVEVGVHQTVPVEVDLPPVRCLDEAAFLPVIQPGDPAARRGIGVTSIPSAVKLVVGGSIPHIYFLIHRWNP